MQQKSNVANKKRNGNTFFELVIYKIVSEAVIVLVILIAYIGYTIVDNMFISRAVEKKKKIENLKASILIYNEKIKEYQDLWSRMLATGDDKRVVSGFTFNKIEKLFKSIESKFDIKNLKISLDKAENKKLIEDIKINHLPSGVKTMSYSFEISGIFDVETDVYNMLMFLDKNLPGIFIVNNLNIDSKIISFSIEELNKSNSLSVIVSGNWLFLTRD